MADVRFEFQNRILIFSPLARNSIQHTHRRTDFTVGNVQLCAGKVLLVHELAFVSSALVAF